MGTRRLRAAARAIGPVAAAALLLTLAPATSPTPQQATESIQLTATTQARAATNPGDRPTVRGLPDIEGAYRFVSHPDFLNQDVGDVTRSPFWRQGMPRGTNSSYEASLDHVIDQMLRHDPQSLLVAGDMVEGAWGQDVLGSGVFGPTRTVDQRRRAVREAAKVYLQQWHRRFATRDLTVWPAIGDHEIGDDPWRPTGNPEQDAWLGFKSRHLWLWKEVADRWLYPDVRAAERTSGSDLRRTGAVSHPPRGQARHTAYATRLSPDLLLVSVDVFRPRSGGGVEIRLDEDQRRWLSTTLRRAKEQRVPWVVVQGHTPVMGPVRTRFSSALTYAGSDLLGLMRRHDVDVYLTGEVHDHTVTRRRGLVQVAHGGLFYRGESSYVVGQATRDRLLLETRYLDGRPRFGGGKLWSTEGGNGPMRVTYDRPSRVVGAYVLERRGAPGDGNRVTTKRGISGVPFRR